VSASSTTDPNRFFGADDAISDHKGGPAALGRSGLSFFFLLDWRIFPDLVATIIAVAYPSGLIPSGRRGSHACRSPIRGVEEKLDRVLAIFYGVLDVKVKGRIEISFFLRSSLQFYVM
jgi:hypothetical protein